MALHHMVEENTRQQPDVELINMASYVAQKKIVSDLAYKTAHYCLMDSIGCGILALQYPACTKLLGPIIKGTQCPIGATVPGTNYYLDPILAAFNIGTMIRWLDYNDTWLAAEWGHPSDNLGAILAVADYVSRKNISENKQPLTMQDVLTVLIKAHEIQGVLALENGFNRIGFDHVILVKIASTAVATALLGGTEVQIANALSQAFLDGAALRTYRHAPNTGTRKSWAAGDATSRAVRLAWLTLQGEMGYSTVLTTPKWGFYDDVMRGEKLKINRPFESYVMENILFKVSYPAEFHAQTAVECAVQLHPAVINRLEDIDRVELTTHESAIRIISKSGALNNPADRDHCLQYMVAVGLLEGDLTADHYEDAYAQNSAIDRLREKMVVTEDQQFSRDYLDPNKRSIANSMQIFFKDGSCTEKVTVEYPIGHKRRREEAIPLLHQKFEQNISSHYDQSKTQQLVELFKNPDALRKMAVNEFMDMLVIE